MLNKGTKDDCGLQPLNFGANKWTIVWTMLLFCAWLKPKRKVVIGSKKFWTNGWTIAIGSGVILLIISKAIDHFSGTTILSGIWNFLMTIWKFLSTTYSWPLWGLILLAFSGLCAVALFLLIVLLFAEKVDTDIDAEWKFLDYREDNFNGIMYRWDYEKYGGKYSIENLTPYCAECKCQLIYEKCPNCGRYYGSKGRVKPELIALIWHRVDQKEQNERTLRK